jgi:hypothetical protein
VDFREEAFELREGHAWHCKPGYKIIVLDAGALRFDMPENWMTEPDEKSVKFFDRQPPDGDCRSEVSLVAGLATVAASAVSERAIHAANRLQIPRQHAKIHPGRSFFLEKGAGRVGVPRRATTTRVDD